MKLGATFHIPATAVFALSIVMGVAAGAGEARADLPSGNFGGGTRIAVGVDNDFCLTGGVQCSAFGAPPAETVFPSPSKFQALTGGGIPINTIADADVAVSTKFVPAGGALAIKRACVSCFQFTSDGVYGIFVEPIVGQNWKSGTYYVQVQVTKGSFVARALTEIKIPF